MARSASRETVVIRRHLQAVLLMTATAQAGSTAAAKESRRHVEAALEVLDRLDASISEQTRLSTVHDPRDSQRCDVCGAISPQAVATGMRPPMLTRVAGVHLPDAERLDPR